MKNKLTFIASILTIILLLVGCSTGNESEDGDNGEKEKGSKDKIVIKFSHVGTPASIKGMAADKFAELVDEKTDGAVEVEVFPSSQLYGDNDELDALISGNVQMINPSVSKLVKLDQRWQFADLPYIFEDSDHVHRFFESDLAKELLESEQLTNSGILGLTFWENGFKNFSNDKHVMTTPEDFKGMKFRAQAGNVLEAQFKMLSAGNTTVPWGETYSALQQGVADGAEATANMMDTASFHEVQDHLTLSEHGRVDYAVLVNKEFWEGIPDDLRDKVHEALMEATEYEWGIAKEFNDESLENLKNGGMEVTELSEDEKSKIKEALQPVYDQFRDKITPELIDGIRELSQ